MVIKLINDIKKRFINSTKSQSVSYITLIFVLFIVLVLFLTQINAELTSLNYKVKYMLENMLNTNVSFSKIDGDFTKELIIHDAVIYHEFRKDIPLVKAKKVIIEFNIAKALLKDSIPINNISRIGVYDYVVYIDEFFNRTKAIQLLIPKDGVRNNPYIIIDIYNGEVKSAFLNKELGKFHARELDVIFKITPTTFSFRGEGYVEGDEPYGNTKTNFRIEATNNMDNEAMYGLIDLENVSYLDQKFKAIAIECMFSERELQFRTRPSKYKPYLKTLPKHQITSYKQNKYDHLIDIAVRYLLKESEIYINVPFDNKNIASKIYAKNFLKKNKLLDFILKHEKWTLQGNAKLKFNGTKLTNVNITLKNAKNIFLEGDKLNVVIKSISPTNNELTKILFEGLDYKDTTGGSIEGNIGFYSNKMPLSGNLNIKRLYLNPIYKILNKNDLTKEDTAKIAFEDQKTIFNTQSILTTNISYNKINQNNYNFKVSRSHLGTIPLPELEGETKYKGKGQLDINLRCNDYINLKALASLNINNLRGVKFNILINALDYDYLLLLVKGKRNFIKPDDKLTLQGQLKGILYPDKIKESEIIGKTIVNLQKGGRQIRPTSSTLGQNGLQIKLPNASNGLAEQAEKIAKFDFKYKNNNLYFNRSYISALDIYFKGIIKLDLKNLYTELTLNYKGLTMYLDGYFKKLKESYYTKLNLIYDNFKKDISTFESKIKLDGQKVILKDGKIRYKRNDYRLSGTIALDPNKISPNLKLSSSQKTLNEKEVNITINGNVTLKSQRESLKAIIPALNIRYNDTKYLLGGKILSIVSKRKRQSGSANELSGYFEEYIIYPSLNVDIINIKTAKSKKLILKGELKNNGKRLNSKIDIIYAESSYTFELDLDYTHANSYQVRLEVLSNIKSNAKTNQKDKLIKAPAEVELNKLIEQSKLFVFAGNISFLPTLENEVVAQGKVTINDYTIDINGSVSYKGRIVNTNIEFKTMEGVDGRLSGYITYTDTNYFPYLRVNLYKDEDKLKDKSLSFLIEGKITEDKEKYKIDTVLNKRLSLKGEFKKYFPLKLNISFNNFPIELNEGTKVILHTKYDDPKGIELRIDMNEISIGGNILLQQLTILDSKAPFKIDTSFSYYTSFKSLRESKAINIGFQTILDRAKDKEKQSLLKMRGLLSYKENTIHLSLKELNKRFNLAIKYGPYEKTLDIMLNKLNINGLVAGLDGILTGHIKTQFLENEDSLEILAERLIVSNGKYNGIPFSGEFTFYKDKLNTKVRSARLNIKDVGLRVKDLIYESAEGNFGSDILKLDLSPKSKVTFGSLMLSYKDLKLILTDFKYQTGVVGINFLSLAKEDKGKDKESNIWDLVQDKGSSIDFKKGFISYKRENVLLIDRFHYNPGKAWNIDFDAKLKSTLVGNKYTGEFNVYGGKNELGNELTITGKKLSENRTYYKDFKLIARSIDKSNWEVKINREDIKLTNLSYDGKRLTYDFEYTSPLAGLVTVGEIDFSKEILNVGIVLYHLNLDKSILTKSFLEKPNGVLDSKLHFSGNIFDPEIDGEIIFRDGNLNLKGESKDEYTEFEDVKLHIEFNNTKVFNKGDKGYNHEIKASGGYLDGYFLIDGYFNTSNWQISDFDINVKTKDHIKLDFVSSFLNYKGRLGLDTNISGRFTGEKNISGIVYAKDADIAYIGEQMNQTYNLLKKLRFNVLKIYIEDDVSVNIGQGNLSLGEVSLKKYNKKKHTGSYLVIKKDMNDIEPRLRGNFEVKRGSFDYLGNTFSIVKGILDLGVDGKNRLRMKAKTRKIRDEQNRSVTVYMVIDDELSNLFKAANKDSRGRTTLEDSLYSTPSKSKEEISLLLYGNLREESQNKLSELNTFGQEANAGKAADILLNLTLVKPIERKLKQIIGIDSFNIKQTILQNTLFYRARSGSGYIYLGDGGYEVHFLSNTEITVGKYLSFISDSLFLSGGLRLEQDPYTGEEGSLKHIWKVSLDADIFPMVGYDTDIMQLNIGVEYQYRQNEIAESQRHEGLIKCELQVEF